MELNNKIYDKIVTLCKIGDGFVNIENYDNAIEKYSEALDLVPDPKDEWETSTWIYTALGDTYFLMKHYKYAAENLYNALNCPGGITNPFILLRLGQSLYECDDLKKSKEYLLRAYMLEGGKIFNDEDEKYYNLIKPLTLT